MYKVYCDGQLLFDPRVDELKITDKKLTLEVNKTGGFDFTIYPTHPLYESIYKLKSIIEVYQDDTLLFYGRVLDDDIGFYNDKKVMCEGALGYLNDSVIRPYEFSGGVSEYINMIISQHNDQVDNYKKLYIGNITIQDDNDYIVRSDATHVKTWDVITNKVIKSFNGYLHFRRENNVNYIDFLQDSTFYSNQKIEFRENLLDLTRTRKGSAIVTSVIPKGARIESDEGNESYVDITSVNNGVDYIYNQDAVNAYGWVYETVEFSDVTLPINLKTKAETYLAEAIKTPVTIELKAIDKSMSDVNFDELNYFEYIEVKSAIHDIDDYYLIKKLSIDMENPANNTIVVGAEYRVFTDQKISTDNKINEIVNTIESNRDRWQNVTEDSYPNVKPEIPTGFSVTAGFKTIQISWDYSNSINVKKYELYAAKSIDYITQSQNLIFEGDSSGYSHVVETGETWYYTLRAVNHHGRPSDFTTIVSASTVKIITDDMLFGSVNADILADLSVDASKLTDSAVTAEKIANLAVGNAAIANGSITNLKIGTGAVDTLQVKDAAITNLKIADLAVDSAKIADLAVTTAKIADASITNAKIANLAVGTAQIQNAAITNAEIADLAVDSAKIANATITDAKIADATITNTKIADATITSAKIADASITNAKIADATITSAKIVSLDADKINVTKLSSISADLGDVTSGTIRSDTTINVGTDLRVGNNIYVGSISSSETKSIVFRDYTKIRGNGDHLYLESLLGSINFEGQINFNKRVGASSHIKSDIPATFNDRVNFTNYRPTYNNVEVALVNHNHDGRYIEQETSGDGLSIGWSTSTDRLVVYRNGVYQGTVAVV